MENKPAHSEQSFRKTPESKKGLDPIQISHTTEEAAADLTTALREGRPLEKDSGDVLIGDLTVDVETSGIPLAPEEKKTWKTMFSRYLGILRGDTNTNPEQGAEIKGLDLKEYGEVFNKVYRTYDLQKSGVRLGTLEAIMMGNKVAKNLENVGFSYIPKHFKKHDREIGQFKDVLNDAIESQSLSRANAGSLARLGLKLGWPVLVPALASLSTSIADGIARKQFVHEKLGMRDSVNKRIASSVFMRDFEFVHDKPPAEIMNIVDKGKEATLDLLDVTYTEVLPRLAAIGSSVAPQLLENPVLGVIGALRLPVSMVAAEEQIRQMLHERKADLDRKNEVDTRILTSLGSVEIIKTSDSIEEAVNDLRDAMHTRDELRTKSDTKEVTRVKRQEYVDMFFDKGVPGVAAGWKFVQEMGWNKEALRRVKNRIKPGWGGDAVEQTNPMVTLLGSMFDQSDIGGDELLAGLKDQMKYANLGAAALSAWTTFGIVSSSQSVIRENVQALTQLYAQRIQPAIQDIKRMDELLGPYDQVDTPDGAREQARKSVGELSNFSISAKDLRFKDILNSVSLDILEGSFVTIKGKSGLGKTTFFRHLMGLYQAPEGAVRFGGEDLQHIKKFGEQSIYSKIAYANQNPQFFENMTLRENLLLWTRRKISDFDVRNILHDLHLDHLTSRLDSKVKHYSGGELRRIGIARALLKDPRVLFLDEPTANLDEESAKQVLDIIQGLRMKRPDMTVVAVTHDPNFEAIAERIVDFRDINPKVSDLEDNQVLTGSAKAV